MLKFTSVSGSVLAITADITLTVTIIRIRIGITDLIIGPITGRIITAGTVTTGIVIPIITGAKFIWNSDTGLARCYFGPAQIF